MMKRFSLNKRLSKSKVKDKDADTLEISGPATQAKPGEKGTGFDVCCFCFFFFLFVFVF